MVIEQQIMLVISYLMAAYPNQNMTRDTVAVYVDQLSDQDPELLLLAARELVSEAEFIPTVAALKARTRALSTQRQMWYSTANYDISGELPERLELPAELRQRWLEEPAVAANLLPA